MSYWESERSITARQIISLDWVLPVLVGLVVFGLRAFSLDRSFDIFIDEVTYLRISRAVADSFHVYLYGEPFFLHPPAWFFIEAAYLKALVPGGLLIDQIHATRLLVALISGFSAGLILLLVRHVAGLTAALVAVLLFALDPFIVKTNSLNMLETSTIMWVLAGYTIIAYGLPRPGVPYALPGARGFTVGRAVAAGLCFGLAMLTKEMALFLTLLPLAAGVGLRWFTERRRAVLIGVTAAAVYAVYPLVVALSGHWTLFAHDKLSGVQRFAGLVKTTGFGHHGAGSPSLIQAVITRLNEFASTYALIALGAAAVVVLLWRGRRLSRWIGTWVASAYALLAYAILFGTLEEQFFYFLVVPALVGCAVAGAELYRLAVIRGVTRQWAAAAIAALLLFAGYGGYTWTLAHTLPDNGFQSVLSYLQVNVPRGTRVASTSETGQFVLEGYRSSPWGGWDDISQLQSANPDYVLVAPHSVAWNHGKEGERLLSWIHRHGDPVFSFRGRSDSELILYRLRKPW